VKTLGSKKKVTEVRKGVFHQKGMGKKKNRFRCPKFFQVHEHTNKNSAQRKKVTRTAKQGGAQKKLKEMGGGTNPKGAAEAGLTETSFPKVYEKATGAFRSRKAISGGKERTWPKVGLGVPENTQTDRRVGLKEKEPPLPAAQALGTQDLFPYVGGGSIRDVATPGEQVPKNKS